LTRVVVPICFGAASLAATLGIFGAPGIRAGSQDVLPVPRLYVFDCGTLTGRNLRTYDLPPEPRDMSVPCFLIVDRRGSLLWEAGLGDRFAGGRETPADRGWRVDKTLRGQLAEIGVTPADITYVAMSHMHADHTGNANDYAGSTWLVQQAERDFAFGPRQNTASYQALARSRTTLLHGDADVFGDGTAVIKSTPGHTPGHQSLFVKLPETGSIVLSGDLYHYPEERTFNRFPTFEVSKEQTARSREAIDALIAATGAQLWIEHDIQGYGRLKKSPAYYR